MYDVLLLEDERTVRKLLHHVLTDAGWRVQQASGIREAFTALSEVGARLLVADKRLLQGEDGHAFARTARQFWPGLSVIFMSSDQAALSGLALQDREWSLRKPLPMRGLVELVAAAIQRDDTADMPIPMALAGRGSKANRHDAYGERA